VGKSSLIEVSWISKTFVNTKALQNVDFSLDRGEIRGLVGENGSGKSTLVSIISGILQPDSGSLRKDGKEYNPHSILDANENRISIIVQEMGTIEGLSVASNMFIGKEDAFTTFGIVWKKKMVRKAAEIFQRYGIFSIDPNLNISELTFEDRKLLEFAKALYIDPDVLIIDETTTALSQTGRDILFSELVKLKNSGKSIIFITHDLNEVFDYCDNVSVMKDGEIIGTAKTSDIDEVILKEMMVGRELQHSYYRVDSEPVYTENPVITVSELSYQDVVRNVSFTLHEGEILGIGGLTDCGMHELGKLIFGMHKPDSGKIEYNFISKKIANQIQAIDAGIAYVPKNRDQESIMLLSTILENISLPSLKRLGKATFIRPRWEKEIAIEGTEKLQVKMSSIDQFCMYLSGGNKQKIAVAKWLVNDSRVFILDCPTRGIDVAVKASIYRLMEKLKTEGCSIIMISEELQELIGMSDRVLILKNGELKVTFDRSKDLSEEKIIHYMI
jgi:ribose transport system ATP-binding protein